MDNDYKEIEFEVGSNLENCVNKLLWYNKKDVRVYGNFNGVKLYSDTVTMDNAYVEIIGKHKSEFDRVVKDQLNDIEREENEHEKRLPELIEYWKQKGREVLAKDKWDYWDKVVPARLNDLYKSMELRCCLDIVEMLNNNCTLIEAKNKIESQGHSGLSFSLVCKMVEKFCKRGSEFVDYVK